MNIAGIGFIVAGIMFCVAALLSGRPSPDVPIGMMFVVIGLGMSNKRQ